MADAKIINYGQQIGGGTTTIPDNTSEALDIESTDAREYVTINTTDGSEAVNIGETAGSLVKLGVSTVTGISGVSSDIQFRGMGASGDVKINNGDGRDVYIYNGSSAVIAKVDASELGVTVGADAVPVHTLHVQDGDLGIVTNEDSPDANRLIFTKSRNATDGVLTSGNQSDNDRHGEILWQASDGDQLINTGSIMVRSYGASSNNSVPSEMIFRINKSAADLPDPDSSIGHCYFRTNGNTGFGDANPNYHLTVGTGKSVPIAYIFNNNTTTMGTTYTQVPNGGSAMILDHRAEIEGLILANTTATNAADASRTGIGFFQRVDLASDEYHYAGAIRTHHEGSAADQKGYMTFHTNSGTDNRSVSERVRISAAGNVGIAESDPECALHITGGSSGLSSLRGGTNLLIEDSDENGIFLRSAASKEQHIYFANSSENANAGMQFQGNANRLNLLAGANTIASLHNDRLGVKVTSPAHPLDVAGTAGLSTGTAWTNTSDSRVKTDIQNIENALDRINQLRPVSFKYTDDYLSVHNEIDGSKRYNSFIAQEYAEVFPDAVTSSGNLERVITEATDDADEVREVLLEDVLQFTPHDLNMFLVRAVQELSAKVTALEEAQGS